MTAPLAPSDLAVLQVHWDATTGKRPLAELSDEELVIRASHAVGILEQSFAEAHDPTAEQRAALVAPLLEAIRRVGLPPRGRA